MQFARFSVIPGIGKPKSGAGLAGRHRPRRSLLPGLSGGSRLVILIVFIVFFGLVATRALIERPGHWRRCLRWCRMVIHGRLADCWLRSASRLRADLLRIARARSGINGMIGRGRIA
jgi:hypothetical protein